MLSHLPIYRRRWLRRISSRENAKSAKTCDLRATDLSTNEVKALFVSATCVGERCHCGKDAVRKVGEEIPFDDPQPARHNLTAYVCVEHYAELMGPVGAEQVARTSASCSPDVVEIVARLRRGCPGVKDHALMHEAADALESMMREKEWQPIETAPRDGDDILVMGTEDFGGRTCLVVSWEDTAPIATHHWATLDGPHYHDAAFEFWRPLPAPPRAALRSEQ